MVPMTISKARQITTILRLVVQKRSSGAVFLRSMDSSSIANTTYGGANVTEFGFCRDPSTAETSSDHDLCV